MDFQCVKSYRYQLNILEIFFSVDMNFLLDAVPVM